MVQYELPHRRFNPLTREWILVSPQRAKRPWLGQVEKPAREHIVEYDPKCYLCPGNERAVGKANPAYTGTYVFDNDFPALLPPGTAVPGGQPEREEAEHSHLFQMEPVAGICRVMCFSPRHDLTLPLLPQANLENVVQTWIDQTHELGSRSEIEYVQVFENKGETMGASNPHPHCQMWSTSFIPNLPAAELAFQRDYLQEHRTCLLCDYLAAERRSGERLAAGNEYFSAVVPYWAIWPFELLLVSHRHVASLTDLNPAEVAALADVLKQVTTRYDNLFEISFPYSMGFHQAPTDGIMRPEAHLHAHFNPPLLRSATVRKFMVGFEMMAMPQRDLTPETAAERLRGLSTEHYSLNNRVGGS